MSGCGEIRWEAPTKLAIVGVFVPWELSNTTNQGFLLPSTHPESQLLNAYQHTTDSPLSGLEWFPLGGGFTAEAKAWVPFCPC